ncbi:Asp-tRNAAsn/Glu-tRNAGln amidotransferase A subunit and related amidases [Hahella chejuensis KCTC 2396]|uniref:Asp-tRNAAsn/Glu-tRNAGln amidotransferase A subunit and related amidases n=1 Tax=Hahella chejuensis (strain KCTC 2396) TaxID=349521 RepID=Q2SLQ6_HAHCH|nr:amidase [Hahella chejuensis]ABC28418.1 Asp-tRNAAsn/Glu-tRNAGln amidotransferase A subunit and related amidases [Hahella chejuensis KCTC 2396]
MSLPLTDDGAQWVKSIQNGECKVEEMCEALITQINRYEPDIRAFAAFDPQKLLQQAQAIDSRPSKGKLSGLPIGVKDIFDTVDFATEYFSPIYRNHRPSRDCSVVARLRQEGAIVMGKTETTEFAFMHTGPTRNPHAMDHTPGSSSAGSAAGLAAGFFPVALGSQTAGSLLKPASYCGLFAFKPTRGIVSLEGVKPLAPSFDTVGWYGRSMNDLRLLAEVLLEPYISLQTSPVTRPLRLACVIDEFWPTVETSVKESFLTSLLTLRSQGHHIENTSTPFGLRQLAESHKIVNDREGSRALAYEYASRRSQLSASTLEMIENGLRLTFVEELAAKTTINAAANAYPQFMADYDAIITLSTPHSAPEGLLTTGTSDLIKVWNALGVPQLNIPLTLPGRLPVGLQIVGIQGGDGWLLEVGRVIAGALGVSTSMMTLKPY